MILMKLWLGFPRILQAGQVEEDTGQDRVSGTKSLILDKQEIPLSVRKTAATLQWIQKDVFSQTLNILTPNF